MENIAMRSSNFEVEDMGAFWIRLSIMAELHLSVLLSANISFSIEANFTLPLGSDSHWYYYFHNSYFAHTHLADFRTTKQMHRNLQGRLGRIMTPSKLVL